MSVEQEVIEQLHKKMDTPEFKKRLRRRLERLHKRMKREEKIQKPTREQMEKEFNI